MSGLAARAADLVIGVSQETCEYLSREEGVPASKVRFINNTVDPMFFELPARVRTGSSLLAVGRLVPEKDHLTLLRAMAVALEAAPKLTLTIVGEGPLRAELEAAIDELGLRAHVTLAGYKGDVPALLQGADAFVMPSITEGTSIALSEAMAAGVPIVASRVRGILAVLAEYDARWLIPAGDVARWADALVAFSRVGPEQRSQLGGSARSIAERRVSVQAYKASLESVYAGLAGSFSTLRE
jgi:glycosyltransferase involved in cell wall biosynthesis